MRPLRGSEAARREILREQGFLDHIAELRGLITASVIVFLAFAIGYWFFSGQILDWLVRDVPVEHLIFSAPSEAFMVRTKLSLVLGGLTAFPYIGYRVWRFVAPGLFRNERRRVMPIVGWSILLFYGGVVFSYFMVVPVIVTFMLGYATEHVQPLITVGAYFKTVSSLCLAFGLVFQLPIVMFMLALAGLVSPRTFLRQWRYAVLLIFIAAAIFTPPDPVSQVLMATPLCVLYIGSALVALVVLRGRKQDARE